VSSGFFLAQGGGGGRMLASFFNRGPKGGSIVWTRTLGEGERGSGAALFDARKKKIVVD